MTDTEQTVTDGSPKGIKETGFIEPLLTGFARFYTFKCAPSAFRWFYYEAKPTAGASQEAPTVNLHSNRLAIDIAAYMLAPLLLVLGAIAPAAQDIHFFLFGVDLPQFSFFYLACFNIFHLMITSFQILVGSSKQKTDGAEKLQYTQSVRRTIIIFIDLMKCVFAFAILYYQLGSTNHSLFNTGACITPDQALVLSFSTATTIGYGTVAPALLLASCLCMLQSLLSLLLVGGLLGQVAGKLKQETVPQNHVEGENPPAPGATIAVAKYEKVSRREMWTNHFCIPLVTQIVAVGLALLAWLAR